MLQNKYFNKKKFSTYNRDLVLNYENLPVSRFTLRLLQRHKWVSFLLNSVLRNRRQTEKTLIVKYTIKNFTCDLCVCEHISESRYFTSTPHASKNIKTPTGPPTTTGAIKAARVGISHHLLRNVILAKRHQQHGHVTYKNTSGFHHQYFGENISGSFLQHATN